MAKDFIVDWSPGLNVMVCSYDPQQKRFHLTLVDTSTRVGQMSLALFKTGKNFVWSWEIDWYTATMH